MQNSQPRFRWLVAGFVVACVAIVARLFAMEIGQGASIRVEATRPTTRNRVIPAMRGRILARDGTVLVTDEPLLSVAVRYRYIEEPPDPHWLRAVARSRLTARERRLPDRVAEEEARVRDERAEMHRRLAELCGMSLEKWQARCREIQDRVRKIADGVNRRHGDESEPHSDANQAPDANGDSWLSSAAGKLFKALFQANQDPPAEIIVEEEFQEQVIARGLSLEAVAEIEGNPDRFPGVSIIHDSRRIYKTADSAAHLLGYVRRPTSAGSKAGEAGIERQCDAILRGRDGSAIDRLDRRGRVVATANERLPLAGRDVVLTIDMRLQKSAEMLLDAALARRLSAATPRNEQTSGGAIIAMDIRTGAILAAASAPRFHPAAFADGDNAAIERLLNDPSHSLFDRTIQMAIPPGSVFKIVTAAALLDDPRFDPQKPFDCQGFLVSPENRRCMIYRRYGVGHGPVALADALAESCNVYFFHHADELGLSPLIDWGRRFGFGELTGVDLPGESRGRLPAIDSPAPSITEHRPRHHGEAESLAIGQGTLTATPLQVVRMVAAIGNGGKLVTPHVVERLGLPTENSGAAGDIESGEIDFRPPQEIAGLDARKLDIVRDGLRRVVADEKGTGHATISLDGVSIAGKTGTAELGDGSADHAWFAGYAPAESPRVAFVVVLEHAGDAAAAAGPVVKRLVERLKNDGYFDRPGSANGP